MLTIHPFEGVSATGSNRDTQNDTFQNEHLGRSTRPVAQP